MRSCGRSCDCWGGSSKNTIHDGRHAECAIKRGDDGSILDTEDPLDTADWYRSDWVQLKILAAGKKMNEVYAISPENKGYAERFRLKLRGFCGIQ